MHLLRLHRSLLLCAATAAAFIFAAAPPAHAQVFVEAGDAGQTPGTAQATGLSQTVGIGTATIFGTFSNGNDADVFRINIVQTGTFSASTVNLLTGTSGGAGGLDTQLFLFDSLFRPVYANDDASGATLQSTLPAHTSFLGSLAVGTYYLAISLSGNNPVNSNNQLVFTTGGGDNTAIRGMAAGINPATWSDFNSETSFPQQGAYQINIFNVPESGSTLLIMLIASAAIFGLRHFTLVAAHVRK
jgi:hypothetical protein